MITRPAAPTPDPQPPEEARDARSEACPAESSPVKVTPPSNEMVLQENCKHGINGAPLNSECAALMKHRARRVTLIFTAAPIGSGPARPAQVAISALCGGRSSLPEVLRE